MRVDPVPDYGASRLHPGYTPSHSFNNFFAFSQ
jgi:hypothetical protein